MENTKIESLFIFIWAIGLILMITGMIGNFTVKHTQRKLRQDEFNKRMDSLDLIIKSNDKKIQEFTKK